ncbi:MULTISPECIES: mobile mystery protein A [Brenneria]|uniref:Mobile mystery protein A n=1 Tax=Brenneria nigrifluens DSM 30175 = ATCC 13028 TaxID=1121120 RepID=A0A2U1UQJ9_9GAMM|nr:MULTISPECIES: mobile mystery protein A [Brenneria]EHD23700.1 mobile mystery protein A [Brenneria sp. EniD312]PWC23948.1 mobile mystery protein A [Brenneria nigrifluens] [Brenneria nigrifluens DSM 30175 = ATCC 13028]QCR06619.1 mobile mystery protein A [Brenneria nigrifluens] [Brenneria nigrifluens DSM 30175 = ATCC 13028]
MWSKELKIKQVDKMLNDIVHQRVIKRPKKGWINLIRTALGMSTRALGDRVGLSQPRVSLIEKGEIDGSITLSTLEKVAEGLDCELVYYLVPKQGKSLEGLREQQAEKKASFINDYAETHMSLEKQPTSESFQTVNKNKLKEDLLKTWRRDFWDIK